MSAEALLRWERPGHGLVPPLDFIPLAEETGLIQPIGAWILKEACTQACLWRADGHARVRVSVNVSARQLLDPDFERMVEQTLRETGLEPDALVLEVTESSVMQNAELTIPKLERVVGTGVRLSLDDFGEGYSSLSHIRRLPIQGLKIARPFVRELGDRDGDPRLVHGIIELARRLELTLVAEGIELRAQEEALRSFGCRLGQGFLFSRPVPASAFRALLAGLAQSSSDLSVVSAVQYSRGPKLRLLAPHGELTDLRALRLQLAVALVVGDPQAAVARVGEAAVLEEDRVLDAAEVAGGDLVAGLGVADRDVLLRVPRGGRARLRHAALEVPDDADVAAVDDLDVGALDQVEAEVALQEEREAPAGGGPAAVDAVTPRLGVLGLLLDGDDAGAPEAASSLAPSR